jgi:hypothetical protein
MLDKICDKIDSLLSQKPSEKTPVLNDSLLRNERLEKEGKDLFYEGLLEELMAERRQMTKEERLSKFRNDSVDEIDTSEMEDFMNKTEGKRHPLDNKKAIKHFAEAISSGLINPSQFLEHEISVNPDQEFAHPDFEFVNPIDTPLAYNE